MSTPIGELDVLQSLMADDALIRRENFNRLFPVEKFQGTYYHYCRMPGAVVADWRTADSLGRFYLANVRGRFDCRLGGIPPG